MVRLWTSQLRSQSRVRISLSLIAGMTGIGTGALLFQPTDAIAQVRQLSLPQTRRLLLHQNWLKVKSLQTSGNSRLQKNFRLTHSKLLPLIR